MIIKIISGGQRGADKAGLDAALSNGITTGGTCPRGWRVELEDGTQGSDPELGTKYGLVEHTSSSYAPRTVKNVLDSDGTVWFGYEHSPGGRLTIRSCIDMGKPYIINPSCNELVTWINKHKVKILNVAGNRVSNFNPNIYKVTYQVIEDAIKSMKKISNE